MRHYKIRNCPSVIFRNPNKGLRIPSHIKNFLKELGWNIKRGMCEEAFKGNHNILIMKRPWGVEFQYAIGNEIEWPKYIGAMATIPNFNITKKQLKDIITNLKTMRITSNPCKPG